MGMTAADGGASLARMNPVARALCALLVAALPALAAPVSADALAPDVYERALQSSLAGAAPAPMLAPMQPAAAPAGLAAIARPLSPGVAILPAGDVPEPGAYALMGLLLLVAGLVLRRSAWSTAGTRRTAGTTPAG